MLSIDSTTVPKDLSNISTDTKASAIDYGYAGLALGIFGLGISVIAIGLSNFLSIDGKKEIKEIKNSIEEIKNYVLYGGFFAKNDSSPSSAIKNLISRGYFIIAAIWIISGLLIAIFYWIIKSNELLGLYSLFGSIIFVLGIVWLGMGIQELRMK